MDISQQMFCHKMSKENFGLCCTHIVFNIRFLSYIASKSWESLVYKRILFRGICDESPLLLFDELWASWGDDALKKNIGEVIWVGNYFNSLKKEIKFYLFVSDIISSDFGLGDLDISLAVLALDEEDDIWELELLSSALGLGNSWISLAWDEMTSSSSSSYMNLRNWKKDWNILYIFLFVHPP